MLGLALEPGRSPRVVRMVGVEQGNQDVDVEQRARIQSSQSSLFGTCTVN